MDRSAKGTRVVFVGLDGADFRLLDRFANDGTMPELRAIFARAERRVMLTQHPPLSPLVWTSMMTGVSPVEHRVLDFTRFHPVTRQQEPITSDERAVPAIWNIARYGGKRVGVFGLWATYPAEPGVVVTDRDLPRDYVAATDLVHARAKEWVTREKPDLAIVYFQGTDEIGHFTSGDIEKARAYFRRIDAILGEWKRIAESLDAELVIASDHGFDWGGAHHESSTATATAAKWHRNEGVWIEWPREAKSAEPAHVDQVCATLIDRLGLPHGEGIAAPIGASHNNASVNYRRYFSVATAAPGRRPSDEQLANLKSLGYIDSTAAAPARASGTRTPQSFNNEGLILREQKRVDDAERAFRAALAIDPKYASARTNLDDLLSTRGVERLHARDCAGALSDFRGVARESARLFAGIAAAEGCLGHDREAEEAMQRAIALDPKLADFPAR
ncbi:MAG TPA: alkaline phosphatase family protein [Thermoanaerobaculia bacterium]|nr:alkaline phosphatase family protein [Thermoanaerobaculia bacterium]